MRLSTTFPLFITPLLVSAASAQTVFVRSTLTLELPSTDVVAIEEAGAVWLEAENDNRSLRRAQNQQRELYNCSYMCEGFKCGMCFVWLKSCWNYSCRRSAIEEELSEINDTSTTSTTASKPIVRKLSYDREECIEKIDEALSIMESAVSSSLEPIVDASDFSCYILEDMEKHETCDGIVSWYLWDSIMSSVTSANFQNYPLVCLSGMTSSNLESIVSKGCNVKNISYSMTGPNNFSYSHVEFESMYFLFGNSGSTIYRSNKTFFGGTYMIDTTVSLKDGSKLNNSFTFFVDDSC